MKKYEGLFILKGAALNPAGKDDPAKAAIERLEAEIKAAGGRVETVQKMDKRPFARVADRKNSTGFYVNIIFESAPPALTALRTKFALNEDVFRVLFSNAPATPPPAPAPTAAAGTAR